MIQELRIFKGHHDRFNILLWSLSLKVLILISVLIFLAGCTTPVYIDSGSATAQGKTIKAVLSDCIGQQVGKVGSTNLSLAKAYIGSTEGLLVCQEISLGIIQSIDEREE